MLPPVEGSAGGFCPFNSRFQKKNPLTNHSMSGIVVLQDRVMYPLERKESSMRVGYLVTKPKAVDFFRDLLVEQGAEKVVVDNFERKRLPELLDGLMSGDSLYVRDLFDLSRNSQTVRDILQRLQDSNIMLFVRGEHVDFADPKVQKELTDVFDYHDTNMQAIKENLDYIAQLRQEREEQKQLNELLRELRQQSGMTQKAFAEYFEIPQRTIENWEGGQRGCPDYLLKLLQYKLKNEGLIK